ncbi:oligosaccharide repeat unit polymerase [Enterococcus faecium]|uniref:O-antigen polymerase n=1 Tax=Enterococcus faecium TaxID=1352 RepID=UPI000F4E008C|nr:O-antigen polymerase [Enterococcus faecium]MCD5099990.1 oligosaccharide repeat unit polymerase [Enterococcus faecium]ROZ26550.1 oligosaccharide repeat unit polymerase [Enterococcus faecium]
MISIIILLLILIIMLFACYLFFRREIISPTFICIAMYVLSLFLMIFYCDKWQVDLSFTTYAAIIIALVSLAAGEFLGTRVAVYSGLRKSYSTVDKENIERQKENGIIISNKTVMICLIFTVLTAVLYFQEIRKIAANSAYAQSVYGQAYSFLMQVRWAKTLEGTEVSYYVQHMYTCCGAIAVVFAYVILFNKINRLHKNGRYLFMYITIALYIGISFMTTGRAQMLNFFVYIIFAWIILIAKKRAWRFGNNIKLFVKAIMIIAVAFLLFYLAGLLTEKSLHYDNFFDNFANYFSSSVYTLNEYLNNPADFSSATDFFGCHTLSGIYSFLRTLGFSIPDSVVALEYIYCGDYLTNIYTPLRRYIQDFGWLGMSLIMFIMGYGYKRLIWRNKRDNSGGLDVIFEAYFMFPLVYIAIEERLFMDVIMIRSIYQVIYIVMIYQWVINRKFFTKKIRLY